MSQSRPRSLYRAADAGGVIEQDAADLLRLRADRHHDVRLHDAGLLAGDDIDRWPQHFAMVEGNRRDGADRRRADDVGRITTAAQPDFEHTQIGRCFREQIERGGGDDLEHGDRGFVVDPLDTLHRSNQLVVLDRVSPATRMRSLKRTRCGDV